MVLPLDMPDDYIWQPGSGKSQLSDVGELAVRLGSPVSYDRRGSVYWMDGFEDGLVHWQVDGAGSDWAGRYQTKYVDSGLLATKITGASDGSKQGFITRSINPSLLTSYGLEVTFSIDVNPDFFFAYIIYYNGTTYFEAAALIDEGDGHVQIIDDTPAITDIITIPIDGESPGLFNTLKFTCDFDNLKYGRLQFNQQDIDISEYGIFTAASTLSPRILLRLGVQSVAGSNALCYIDNVIVTVGDP